MRNQKGYTLIELLTVMACLAVVIAVIAIAIFLGVTVYQRTNAEPADCVEATVENKV